jgi:hypothetical protein
MFHTSNITVHPLGEIWFIPFLIATDASIFSLFQTFHCFSFDTRRNGNCHGVTDEETLKKPLYHVEANVITRYTLRMKRSSVTVLSREADGCALLSLNSKSATEWSFVIEFDTNYPWFICCHIHFMDIIPSLAYAWLRIRFCFWKNCNASAWGVCYSTTCRNGKRCPNA